MRLYCRAVLSFTRCPVKLRKVESETQESSHRVLKETRLFS